MLGRSKLKLALLLALVVMGLFVTGQPSQMSSENATANTGEVVILNFAFEPATLTVNVGTKVTWINRDDDPHTVTDTEKRFGSKALDTGDRFTTEFTKPGTYNYYCALHPKMTGQVIVK